MPSFKPCTSSVACPSSQVTQNTWRRLRRLAQNQRDVLTWQRGERGAANAYLGVIPSFADPALAQVAGRLAADETMHWTVLAQALSQPLPTNALSFGAWHIQDSHSGSGRFLPGCHRTSSSSGATVTVQGCVARACLATQRNATEEYLHVHHRLGRCLFSALQHQAWSMPQGTPHAVSNSMKAAVWLVIL